MHRAFTPWVLQIFQNAAGDAGATGWWAAAFVTVLLLDKDFRANQVSYWMHWQNQASQSPRFI